MWIINIIKWFAGFFEDESGSASSKRAALYISYLFMYLQVDAGIDGKLSDTQMNYYLLLANVLIIFFSVGAISAENLTKILNKAQSSESKKMEVTKTEEVDGTKKTGS